MDDVEDKGGQVDETAKKGLTRRRFLQGAAVAGAAAGVSSGILGVPSALASGGSTWSQEDASGVTWDAETDIVLIGSGYAAFCAAIEAYDGLVAAGVTKPNLLIVEKQPANAMGGNSILCAGSAQFAGTHIEKTEGPVAGYPDTNNDTEQWMFQDSLAWGDYRANQDILEAIVTGQDDTTLWLEKLGITFATPTSYQAGMRSTVARTHTPAKCTKAVTDPLYYPGSGGISYWTVMYNGLKARGFTAGSAFGKNNILTEHLVSRFIQAGTDGPVVGVEVQNVTAAGGPTLNIRARRAVFIGAGGWKSNSGMRTNWDPRLDDDFSAGGWPYAKSYGEMIMAANDIGADLTGMDFVGEYRFKWATRLYQHWTPDPTTGSYITQPTDSVGVSVPNGFAKTMCVGADGHRFIDEYTSNLIDAQAFAEAYACMSKPRVVWAVMDNATVPAAWTAGIKINNANAAPYLSPDMMATGADLPTLAKNMGLSAAAQAAFVTEVGNYNKYVASAMADSKNPVSYDTDFGKPNAQMTAQIATGPFWAVQAQFFIHDQMSGITVNVMGQVVKRNGHRGPGIIPLALQPVIPRLYAAGEVAGGYYGNERGHGKIGCIMNLSRKVGKNLAKENAMGNAKTSLALVSSAAKARHGRTVTLTGTLASPGGLLTGSQVSLQVMVPGTAYATVGDPMDLSAARTAAATYKLATKGTYRFRMQFAGNGSFMASTSNEVVVTSL